MDALAEASLKRTACDFGRPLRRREFARARRQDDDLIVWNQKVGQGSEGSRMGGERTVEVDRDFQCGCSTPAIVLRFKP